MDEYLCGLFEGERLLGEDEELQEAGGQVLKGLLFFGLMSDDWLVRLYDGGHCFDCLPKSPPDIVVLGGLLDHLQALKDVHNVVDASSFNRQLQGYFV